jgi:hypothetical protein
MALASSKEVHARRGIHFLVKIALNLGQVSHVYQTVTAAAGGPARRSPELGFWPQAILGESYEAERRLDWVAFAAYNLAGLDAAFYISDLNRKAPHGGALLRKYPATWAKPPSPDAPFSERKSFAQQGCFWSVRPCQEYLQFQRCLRRRGRLKSSAIPFAGLRAEPG